MYRVHHQKRVRRRRPLPDLLENKPTQQPTQCSIGKGLHPTLGFNYNNAKSDQV